MAQPQPGDEHHATDAVLSGSVERIRSSRQLIEEIDERLLRGQRLLDDEDTTA